MGIYALPKRETLLCDICLERRAPPARSQGASMDQQPPTPSKDVSLQRVGKEAILHDRRNDRAHVINASAAQIWELCDGRNSLDQIVSAFAASYDLPESAVQEDVNYILARFRELHVLE
jgi:hypothetical protein